ncbi:unnamed protein product [Microthlaspi erraticum]|uniref:Uncharacterized protein n=1 Tax=Microthlaspi erraticum TaxID=1685480 RepID=A0A6D2L8U3_9BRAS|nr:unnamed protein product [Microthlaspi erraticum]
MKVWASKRASGRPRRWDGRSGRSAGHRVVAESERSWPDGFTVGRRGRTDEIWPMILGRTWDVLPGSDGCIGRGTRGLRGREACFPARALWSCAAGVGVLADRGTMFPGSCCVIGRVGLDFGRDFSRTDTLAERGTFVPRPAGLRGWALILDRAVWTVFTLLV